MKKKNCLKRRTFTSLLVLFSFVVLAFSGIILYIFPHGRVAYQTGFHLLGLDKDQWDTLHICFSFLFTAFAVIHIVNNRRVLTRYLRGKAENTIGMKREFFAAFAVSAAFAIGSILFIPPFKNIKGLSESIKESWVASSELKSPLPDAELQSLESLGSRFGFDPFKAAADLREAGLDIHGLDETLTDIAERNGTTPAAVLDEVAPDLGRKGRGRGLGRGEGRGLGRGEGRGLGRGEGRGLGRGEGRGLGRGEGRGLGRGEESGSEL